MDEDRLNMEVRKFLKTVGITSQREIERALREALASGRVAAGETLAASMVLRIEPLGLEHRVDGTITLG